MLVCAIVYPCMDCNRVGLSPFAFLFVGVWGLRQRGCPWVGQDPEGPSRTPNPALAAQLAELAGYCHSYQYSVFRIISLDRR